MPASNPPVPAAAAEVGDPKQAQAMRGRLKLRDIAPLQLDYDHCGKWRHALSEIDGKPHSEWLIVAGMLRAQIAAGKKRFLTPQHVIDHWTLYASGQVPGQREADQVRATTEVSTAYRYVESNREPHAAE